jgi:hypothetical protein
MGVFDEAVTAGQDAARGVVERALAAKDAALESAVEQLEVVTADRDLIAAALASSEDDLKATQSALADAVAERDRFAVDLAAALARIAELEQGVVVPQKPRTILGACPLSGGMSTQGVGNVVARWGEGVAVRLFADEGDGWLAAPPLGSAGRLLLSWKPSLTRPVDEAATLAALAGLPAGSKVCVWHEPDVKARKGAAVAPMKARAAEFAAIVRRHRPDLDVMAVLSGWTFDPSTSFDPLAYVDLGSFDVLALDLDGLDGPKDYRPVVAKAQDWMRRNGVTRWTVAEYGVKLTTSFTATHRVGWLNEQTTALLELDWPPEDVCLFEVDTTAARSYILATPAEQNAWRTLITSAR